MSGRAQSSSESHLVTQATSTLQTTTWQRIGPIVSLVFLAPIIAEVLSGTTRVSVIFALVPEILIWGFGTLLVRECARRWGKGWRSVLLLGLALSVAEEFVIQQTSISPLVRMGEHEYGRMWGVNWPYFLWALGFESVWVVLVPIQLTELIFPARRKEAWLRLRGFITVSVIFVLGAGIGWYGWTQRARVKVMHMQPYNPPSLYIAMGVCVVLLLIFLAYALPSGNVRDDRTALRSVPPPWTVGAIVFVLGAAWIVFEQLVWGVGARPGAPVGLVLGGGLAWAALTFYVVRRWTSSGNWDDMDRFALVFGGIMACMVGGFVIFWLTGARRVDWIGKLVLNAAATIWLISIWRKVARRGQFSLK